MFLSGPVPVACPPSVLVAVPVAVLLSVAFHAASVANRYPACGMVWFTIAVWITAEESFRVDALNQ